MESSLCWMCGKLNNWYIPRRQKFRIWKDRLHNEKMPSAFCWAIAPETFHAARSEDGNPAGTSGLPSSLLARRPDIAQAEQVLIAANAQIGVARAAYFPQISLTGSAGFESTALTNLFTGPAGLWNLAGSFSQPIFQGGRLKSNVRLAEAQQQQAVLAYQQTIKGAFRDVSDALVAYRKNREFRIQQEHLVEAAQDAARLSEVRFKAGTTDYLEVLTNETNSFSAELGLAQAQGNELTALVQLYQALGGGWK